MPANNSKNKLRKTKIKLSAFHSPGLMLATMRYLCSRFRLMCFVSSFGSIRECIWDNAGELCVLLPLLEPVAPVVYSSD